MKTTQIRGLVVNETGGSEFWEVLVDLELDDADIIAEHRLTFGAAPPPPSGEYKLVFFYKNRRHEEHGRIHGRSWGQAIMDVR